MDATYLRIKNFSEHQHYDPKKRSTPPWIKLFVRLLEDLDFQRLDEATQYQLVRIWIVAARSSSLTLDEEGLLVPVIANDAQSLQRAISSVKRVPLALLIREGWLIPVDEDDLLTAEQIEAAPSRASVRASKRASGSASEGDSASLRSREAEVSEVLGVTSGRHFEDESLPEMINPENEFAVAKLMRAIGSHADTGTRLVVAKLAVGLPPAALAKVTESVEQNHPRNRAAYAVRALQAEAKERSAA